MTSSKWFVCPQPNPAAETRLFIFPYAGGSPAAFNKWISEIFETRIAHYPGRGSRSNEPLLKSIDALVENILSAIQPLLDKPFAFFGHSMGCMIAFELAQKLPQQNLPQPKRLFISACGAPNIPDPNQPIHTLADDEFLEALKRFNGIPFEIVNQPEALEILLPILRADFEAVETHRFNSGEPPLDIPIVAFGGLDDPRVGRERVEAWATQTTAAFKAEYFHGDHFFIDHAKENILHAMSTSLLFRAGVSG